MTIYRKNCDCFKRDNWQSPSCQVAGWQSIETIMSASKGTLDLLFKSYLISDSSPSPWAVITLGHLTHFVNISFLINVKEIDLGHCATHHNVTKINHFDIHQKPSMVYQEQSWPNCICIHCCVFLVFVYIWSHICVYLTSICIHFCVFLVFVYIWQVFVFTFVSSLYLCIFYKYELVSPEETPNIGNYEHYSQYGDCTIWVGWACRQGGEDVTSWSSFIKVGGLWIHPLVYYMFYMYMY